MKEQNGKNKRGGQPGNQNARKHGFYSNTMDEEEWLDLEQAMVAQGLDEEIAMMRVKIKAVLRHDPKNFKLIAHGTESLARLLRQAENVCR